MAARTLLVPIVDVASSLLALALRAARPVLGPARRLWRLASLRAVADGIVPVSTQFDGSVETSGRVRLDLGEHCRLGRRVFLETCESGVIRFGANVRVNAGTFIVAYSEVSIGSGSLIGEYVSIRDADHGIAPGVPIRQQSHASRPIRIGEGAWIGRGSVVLKGVTIGDGAVVAANSVVTRDVRPSAIVAGVPAKEIRAREARATAAEPQRGTGSGAGP